MSDHCDEHAALKAENARLRTELAEIHKALDQTFPDWRRDDGHPLTPGEAILEDERISMRLYADAYNGRDAARKWALARKRSLGILRRDLRVATLGMDESPGTTYEDRIDWLCGLAQKHMDERDAARAELARLREHGNNQRDGRADELRQEAGDISRRTDGDASPRCPR